METGVSFDRYRFVASTGQLWFDDAQAWAYKATRVPNCHYWPFAHRVSALGQLQDIEALPLAKSELLQRQPAFSCAFAKQRLFYIKNPAHVERYVQGLRKAGFGE
jgi:hypothetical protein